MGECAADFLRDGQELGSNLCAQGGLLGLGDKKKLQATLGDSLINTFWFHSSDKTFPPELNLHDSEFTVKVLKWGTEGQVNTNIKIKKIKSVAAHKNQSADL